MMVRVGIRLDLMLGVEWSVNLYCKYYSEGDNFIPKPSFQRCLLCTFSQACS
jgi:hypothetical protein